MLLYHYYQLMSAKLDVNFAEIVQQVYFQSTRLYSLVVCADELCYCYLSLFLMFSAQASLMIYLYCCYMQPAFDLNLPEDITHQVYVLLCKIALVRYLVMIFLCF